MAATLKKSKNQTKAAAGGSNKAAKAFKAKKQPKAAPAPKDGLGKACRTILYVTDFAKALNFYENVLGLTLSYPASDGWAEFKTGDSSLSIHGGRDMASTTKGICSVGFHVADFDAAMARLAGKGVVMGEPFSPCSDKRVSHFSDPDGNELSIEGK